MSFEHGFRVSVTRAAAGILLLAGMTSSAMAQERQEDRYRIEAGGYFLVRYDNTFSLTDAGSGLGIALNPEDTLGVDTEQRVARVHARYRFNPAHMLTLGWYRISNSGSRSIETEIDWVDEEGNPIVIPIGAEVNTSLKFDIYKLGYLWSFHHTDKVELSAGAGLHITTLAVGLEAETTSTGIDARSVSTTVPLPVLSFGVRYKVTPRLSWQLKSEFFAMRFDDWAGGYTDTQLGLEYMIWENVGLGLAIGGNALRIEEEPDEYRFRYDNRISGAFLSVLAKF